MMRKSNIGIIKIFLTFCFMIPGFIVIKGQENSEVKKKITEIKLNDDLIFGEGVSNDKEVAYGLALDDLLIFANEIKERNSQESLSMTDLVTKIETLVYENGTRFEVLVYIPYNVLIETQRKGSLTKGGGITLTRPGIIEMEEDSEIIEETPPIAETPIVEETPPITDTTMVEETTLIAETPMLEETPVPVIEEVVVAQEEEPVKEEPALQPAPSSQIIAQESPKSEELKKSYSSSTAGEVEEFLLTQDNFAEIKSFLSDMKRSGKIIETGASDTLYGLPQDASLILIDELGGILAYLSPVTPQGRINYKTHKSDSENNYNSKFIVWYRK